MSERRGPGHSRRIRVFVQVVNALEAKQIVFDAASRRRLQAGINKVADAVSVTLGPRGTFTPMAIGALKLE